MKRSHIASHTIDRKFEYVKMLLWRGLSDMIRRDAVRQNDGPMITLYWKCDLPQFIKNNHTKYTILGHRLIASWNGFLPERLRQDLI
ncbi:hypothetical protein DPMN_045041 [Dreissena polymorpha]|uniref:Uncharacterized protein n=1 Tax=Dreissena polymorpha TaxID=45954 RepID=A0A9D4D701_DREPO|nr:hypothetical protein DPMN_045041 [Dreissena polymorpha]